VTRLTLSSYRYRDALLPSLSDDPIYPYPRLDFDKVKSPTASTFTAVVLENPYLTVTVLPELGGRIYAIRDRITGRNITYRNPVIKPTRWGIRGWWLATGGIVWAFPTEEHGLNEWRPWSYGIERVPGQVSVTVSDREDRTGLVVAVKITLDAAHAYLTLRPSIQNPTSSSQTYQFWLNAMLSLSGNKVSDDTRFVLPASTVRIHSSGDGSLPGSGTDISWPQYGGRDFSTYRSWQGYLGFFASPAKANYVGAYDTVADQGVVRIFPREAAPGVKFFAPRGLDPKLWTDNNSSYFELWGGVTPTFWDNTTLEPNQTLAWTEHWYPISGLRGALNYADQLAAVRLQGFENRVEVAVAPTQAITGKVVLWLDGAPAKEWPATLRPGRPWRQTWKLTGTASAIGLQLVDGQGQVIARYGQAP
jgi:hypothetical protein